MSLLTSTISTFTKALPRTRANRLLILIYHRVHKHPDPMFPDEVDAERFERHMSVVRRYCHPMSLREAVVGLAQSKLPQRAVAVTFDDGYSDNATVALPILQRHKICATFFVAPGFLDGGHMWNDAIVESVRHARGSSLDLAELGLGVGMLGDVRTRGHLAQGIIRKVKHLHPAERLAKVEALARRTGVELPTDIMMTARQVRHLADVGMEIGAHTVTHPILRTLSDAEASMEIDGSRRALEEITGDSVRAFAYPNGQPGDDYSERDVGIVRSLGFGYAVSTRRGAAAAATDMFQLPRFTPWDRSDQRWLARLLLEFGHPA